MRWYMEGAEMWSVLPLVLPSFVYILVMSVTYSTVADSRTVVKHLYNVEMSVWRLFSGLFLLRILFVLFKKRQTVSLEDTLLQLAWHTQSSSFNNIIHDAVRLQTVLWPQW